MTIVYSSHVLKIGRVFFSSRTESDLFLLLFVICIGFTAINVSVKNVFPNFLTRTTDRKVDMAYVHLQCSQTALDMSKFCFIGGGTALM